MSIGPALDFFRKMNYHCLKYFYKTLGREGAMIYFKMFFALNQSWFGVYFKNKPRNLFYLSFFCSGIIEPAFDGRRKGYKGKIFNGKDFNSFPVKFDQNELHFWGKHPALDDLNIFFSFYKGSGPLWIGDYEIRGIGKGKAECVIFENNLRLFRTKKIPKFLELEGTN